ncbi:redoxin domain-containing protein [Oceanobacillus sp. CAU 1775]
MKRSFIFRLSTLIVILSAIIYVLFMNITSDSSKLKTGSKTSDFELTQLNENHEETLMRLSELEGTGVVINFWASYCEPCESQLAYMEALYREYQDDIELNLFAATGFVIVSTTFNALDYNVSFLVPEEGDVKIEKYNMPAIVSPTNGEMAQDKMEPLFETPSRFKGENAARKLNTIIWSFSIGFIMYIITRLILRKRVAAGIQPLLKGLVQI